MFRHVRINRRLLSIVEYCTRYPASRGVELVDNRNYVISLVVSTLIPLLLVAGCAPVPVTVGAHDDLVAPVVELPIAPDWNLDPLPQEAPPAAAGQPEEPPAAGDEDDGIPPRYAIDPVYFRLIQYPQPGDDQPIKPVVALTIDDGPRHFTTDMLKVLEDHGVKALFFVNGVHLSQYGESVQLAHAQGHMIGNHAWSHNDLGKMPGEQIRIEIERTSAMIRELTGADPLYFRAPFGNYPPLALQVASELGMQSINWSIDPRDWSYHDPARAHEIVDHIVEHLHPGAVILIHQHAVTLDILSDLIQAVRAQGYEFVLPTDLIRSEEELAAFMTGHI